jgi:hypothetical protein
MRNRTQDRIEEIATAENRDIITLALVEQGIAIGRQLMEEMIRSQTEGKGNGAAVPAPTAAEALTLSEPESRPALNEVGSASALQARRAGRPRVN